MTELEIVYFGLGAIFGVLLHQVVLQITIKKYLRKHGITK